MSTPHITEKNTGNIRYFYTFYVSSVSWRLVVTAILSNDIQW